MGDTAEKLPEVVGNNIVAVDQSPLAAAERLLTAGADLDKIEKMLELQERFERNEAKKSYTQAMANFKANPPTIYKDKKVGFDHKKGSGVTNYSHATLGNVTEKINSALAEHGLSAAWKTDQGQSGITVTCTITHKLGYSESTSLTAGADNTGKKNSIQAIGSTVTYLQRYTILALTGLATHDQDDDGAASEQKPERSYHDRLADLKAKDPEAYKMVCEDWQVDSLEDAGTEDTQEGILKQIELYMTKEWKGWYRLRMENYELLETWPDPIDIEQCIQAVNQAKIAINKQNGG